MQKVTNSILSFFVIVMVASFAISTPSQAHEGHDHGAAGGKSSGPIAPHGGAIKKSKTYFWEVVQEDAKLNLYIFNSSMQSVLGDAKPGLPEVVVMIPKKGKKKYIPNQEADGWSINPEVKGAHRYELQLKYRGENVTFQLEP